MIYDFVALDFETASNELTSACSLGLAFVKGAKVVDTKYFLIKPPGKFSPHSTAIHGIRAEDVKDAPTFKDIWPELYPLIKGQLLVAHAAKFDLNVLIMSCHYYGIPLPNLRYMDSIDLFKAAYPNHKKASLDYCARFLHIPLENHHNALDDAVASAHIAIKAIKRIKRMPLTDMILAFQSSSLKTNSIVVALDHLDEKHPLARKNLMLTTDLTPHKKNGDASYQIELIDLPKK